MPNLHESAMKTSFQTSCIKSPTPQFIMQNEEINNCRSDTTNEFRIDDIKYVQQSSINAKNTNDNITQFYKPCTFNSTEDKFINHNDIQIKRNFLPHSEYEIALSVSDKNTNLHESNSQSRSSGSSSVFSGSEIIRQNSLTFDGSQRGEFTRFSEMGDDENESQMSEMSELFVSTAVKSSLEKNVYDRTDEDIDNILDFIEFYTAFSRFSHHIRRDIAKVMLLAIVPKAGTLILNDGELYDSWTVIISGEVENIKKDGTKEYLLRVGDSFGIGVNENNEYHEGTMWTLVDECYFLCVAKLDYCRIMEQSDNSLRFDTDDASNVILVKEVVKQSNGSFCEVVLKASNLILRKHLLETSSSHHFSFVEEYLLTHRMFTDGGVTELCEYLLEQFRTNELHEAVANVFLIWIRCFFWDFTQNALLRTALDEILNLLNNENMETLFKLLCTACTEKSGIEQITITRSDRRSPLGFTLDGGLSKGYPPFISNIDEFSKAKEFGLRVGHQIIEVNSVSVEFMPIQKILIMMKEATHLCLSLKLNLIGFNEFLRYPNKFPSKQPRISSGMSSISSNGSVVNNPVMNSGYSFVALNENSKNTQQMSSSENQKLTKSRSRISNIKKTFSKLASHRITRSNGNDHKDSIAPKEVLNFREERDKNINTQKYLFNKKSPNESTHILEDSKSILNDNNNVEYPSSFSHTLQTSIQSQGLFHDDELPLVIKIYRPDHSFRILPVHRDTTAKQAVMLAVNAFDISSHSGLFALCEVSNENGVISRKRLPDSLSNLAEYIRLNARYYLKENCYTDLVIPDEISNELSDRLEIQFLNLNIMDIVAQLCLRDLNLFRKIDPSELLTYSFQLSKDVNIENVKNFAKLVNDEMYWVITEIVRERSIWRRVKIIKAFVKIAKLCQEMKNFNSFFAIISGLDHKIVTRLRNTWDRVPERTHAILSELKIILDPSRNMIRYRKLLKIASLNPPLIPMFPLCLKDLTFLNQGNETFVDGLVNFEKFRMIANEIRSIISMRFSNMDIDAMFASPTPFQFVFTALGSNSYKSIPSLNDRFNLLSPSNSKRLYEECMMAKRAKYYLNSVDVINDEQRLTDIADFCEASCDSPDQRSDRFLFMQSGSSKSGKVKPGPSFYRKMSTSKPLTLDSITYGTNLPKNPDQFLHKRECGSIDHGVLKTSHRPLQYYLHDIKSNQCNCINDIRQDINKLSLSMDADSGRASLTSQDITSDNKGPSHGIVVRHRTLSSGAVSDRFVINKIQSMKKCDEKKNDNQSVCDDNNLEPIDIQMIVPKNEYPNRIANFNNDLRCSSRSDRYRHGPISITDLFQRKPTQDKSTCTKNKHPRYNL